MDRTYQREDLSSYGFGAKVIPEFSEEKKKIFRGCLHHVGTKKFPIKAQSIIPNENAFKVSILSLRLKSEATRRLFFQ